MQDRFFGKREGIKTIHLYFNGNVTQDELESLVENGYEPDVKDALDGRFDLRMTIDLGQEKKERAKYLEFARLFPESAILTAFKSALDEHASMAFVEAQMKV